MSATILQRVRRSRFWSSVVGTFESSVTGAQRVAAPTNLELADGSALDTLFVILALQDGVDKDAGSMNLVRVQLAKSGEVFYFGDDVIGGGGPHGIEVARGLAINEIAPAIALPGFDESEVATKAAFENAHVAAEVARLLAFGDHRAKASGRIERGNAGASRAQPLCESALRIQF